MNHRVVVTGSSGRIGRAAVTGLLQAKIPVVGFDLTPSPGIDPDSMVIGSVTDRAAVEKACQGASAIIHLAAVPDDSKTADGKIIYDPDHFPTQLLPNNLLGSFHIVDVARALRIPRVILASTGQVIDGHLEAERLPVTPDMDYQPLYLYACTKVFLEQLGRVYSQHHGLTVVAVRLGWCPRNQGQAREIAADPMSQDVYLSPDDIGGFFTAAVNAANLPKFSTMFCSSRYTHTLTYSLTESKTLLGWEPKDQWPTGSESLLKTP
jgi:uronate dehydrogenase